MHRLPSPFVLRPIIPLDKRGVYGLGWRTASDCLPSVPGWYRVVSATCPMEVGLLNDLSQAGDETIHWTQSVLRVIRTIFEREERDRRVVHYHPDLFARRRGA